MGLNLYVMDQSSVSSTVHSSVSLTRRLVYMLALLPIALALASIVAWVYGPSPYDFSFDPNRSLHLIFLLFWVSGAILIWRSTIAWTVARTWLTLTLSVIPFALGVYAKPLWNPGGWLGVYEIELCSGQHLLSITVWVWLMVWIWWRLEKAPMVDLDSEGQTQGTRVTPIAGRVVASIATIPLIVGLMWIIDMAWWELVGVREPFRFVASYATVTPIAIVAWILIWRTVVVWSRKIIRNTISLALVFFVLPVLALWLFLMSGNRNELLGALFYASPLIGWGIWMATTVLIWDFVPTAMGGRSELPKCLRCGYLLKGLTGTRCPECGAEPTLDELWGGA